eukprot:scaffold106_cov380-Prasinococcus_capsulatus_cf.AAC.20
MGARDGMGWDGMGCDGGADAGGLAAAERGLPTAVSWRTAAPSLGGVGAAAQRPEGACTHDRTKAWPGRSQGRECGVPRLLSTHTGCRRWAGC